MTTQRAHLMANFATGDPDENMVDLDTRQCGECGQEISPVLGRVIQSNIRWNVWEAGSYEHVLQPDWSHLPVDGGPWETCSDIGKSWHADPCDICDVR